MGEIVSTVYIVYIVSILYAPGMVYDRVISLECLDQVVNYPGSLNSGLVNLFQLLAHPGNKLIKCLKMK